METYKLQMKIGPHEFCGEGKEDAVRRDFEEWKTLIASQPLPPHDQDEKDGPRGSEFDEKFLSRVFREGEEGVSLNILPQSDSRDADAILLILFGAQRRKGLEELTVLQLKAALQQSGCRVERVDKAANSYVREGFLHKGGLGKGGRYGLTNSGMRKAEQVLADLNR